MLDAPIKMSDLFTADPEPVKVREETQFFNPKAVKREKPKVKKEGEIPAQLPSTFFMSRNAGTGLNKEVFLENFDIYAGGKTLISSSSMRLLVGRRYGLVGRNGTGKSTLLRHISGRELDVPRHMSILHVEQEVQGDDTSVIDSVLESDQERYQLLLDEKVLLEKMPSITDPKEQKEADEELLEIYAKLAEIGADESLSK